MNVFAESKLPEIDALNYTFFPIYIDPLLSNFGDQYSPRAFVEWCRNEFIYNTTTGILSSQSCPECVVTLPFFLNVFSVFNFSEFQLL